jgi:nicotinamide mononucleotide transporter
MDWLQIFTLVTGVLYMILEVRQKNFMWVVGIATSLAAMWVFFRQGLYASFGLNTYYFITAFIGLWHWRRDKQSVASVGTIDVEDSGRSADVIVLNKLTGRTVVSSVLVTVMGVLALSWGMESLHDTGLLAENPMSLLDSAVAVLSAVATWWLVKSYREQWWLWIVADTLSVLLCLMQEMWWMAVLYVAYVIAAVYGLRYWRQRGVYLGETQ